MRKMTLFLALVAVCVGLAAPALGQRFTASLRGKVTAGDAATPVPGAKVTLVNPETGLTRTVDTNAGGTFAFGDLPVGSFEIAVVAPQFRTSVVENIELNVADVREINVELEPGEIADEITVTSPQIVVETIGGEVSNVISGEEIRELPLNGRNFTQLTQLMPGVSTPDNLSYTNKGLLSGVDASISGGSATGNLWAVDGADNNDRGSNRTILVYPSIEAIEEFKIHRNSYGPEFGGAGGAQINLVTKSGTNRYHGSLFGFVRDDSFNEKNFFLEQTGGEKEALERSDYGFSLGGPILQDRLHFFVSGEWNDETRGVVRSETVPTAAERMGDFSQTEACEGVAPIDPATGNPFPNNQIPADRLSDGGLALLNLYPEATGPCGEWVEAVPTDIDWVQANARVDWTVTDDTRVLLRYTRDDWENPAPNAGTANGLWGDDPFPAVDSAWEQPGESLVFQINQVFGSSIVNTFTYSTSGNEIEIQRGADGGLNAAANSAVPTFFPEDGKRNPDDERAHPVYWGGATGTDLWTIAPWQNKQDIVQFKNDYQQVFGDHWMKAGVLYSDNEKAENCCGASAFEAPHFWGGAGLGGWGTTTNNQIADILLEDMYHGYDETAFQPAPVAEWEDIEVYVGDSWKVASNLTVDYGVRYSRFEEVVARDDNIVAFYPELFDPALGNAPCNGVAQPPGTNPCAEAGLEGGGQAASRALVESDDDNFAPRLGVAWDVFGQGNSVLRAGFGQFYQRERVSIQLDMGGQPPFTQNTSGIRPLDFADPTFLSPIGVPNRGINPDNETPYNLQFNLTWEQRLGDNTSLELSYVGNRGRHLVNKYDVNQIPRGDLDGNGVPDRLDYIRAGGDGDGSYRPFFTGGANRILYWDYNGESEYDALQTQLQTRWGRASQAQLSYTWSRFKANTSVLSSSAGEEAVQATDISDFGLDWADADLHREHIFNASAIWNLPTFEGHGGFKEWVLGDWTVAGVVGYSSGVPVTLYVSSIPGLGGGGWAGTGYDDNNRPIRVPGVSCSGRGDQVINPDAFTLDGARLGDVSQMARRGACEGPDYFQADLSFYKRIPLGNRFDGQFRFEIFNLTDEVNFVSNSIALDTTPFNVVYGNDAGEEVPVEEATQILSADFPDNWGEASAVRAPRQVQLGFKLSF